MGEAGRAAELRTMPRQDTTLESEGAEFLVLGQLLIRGIAAYKTYTNMPGYDIVAAHPENKRCARIQVKSRWRTGAPSFLIKNFDCDFVVVVLLNRGRKGGGGEIKEPEYFVFPVEIVKSAPRGKEWGRVDLKKIPDLEPYREWKPVIEFLNGC